MSDPINDDLPQRWKANRPRCRHCLRDLTICACIAAFGLAAFRQAELPPEQAVARGVDFALSTATTSVSGTSATYGLTFAPSFHNEITGIEIVTPAPVIGRTASVRQHVEERAEPLTVIAFTPERRS